jgi:hypothetical protein
MISKHRFNQVTAKSWLKSKALMKWSTISMILKQKSILNELKKKTKLLMKERTLNLECMLGIMKANSISLWSRPRLKSSKRNMAMLIPSFRRGCQIIWRHFKRLSTRWHRSSLWCLVFILVWISNLKDISPKIWFATTPKTNHYIVNPRDFTANCTRRTTFSRNWRILSNLGTKAIYQISKKS